jgi:hypothetical protein
MLKAVIRDDSLPYCYVRMHKNQNSLIRLIIIIIICNSDNGVLLGNKKFHFASTYWCYY